MNVTFAQAQSEVVSIVRREKVVTLPLLIRELEKLMPSGRVAIAVHNLVNDRILVEEAAVDGDTRTIYYRMREV